MTEVDIKLKDKKSHNTTTSCIVGISEVSGKYARSQTRSPGKLNKGRQSAFDPKPSLKLSAKHQSLGYVRRTRLDGGSSPASQFPRGFRLPLRHKDLVQEQSLIGRLARQLMRMITPEGTANFGMSLLYKSIANHGKLVLGLALNCTRIVHNNSCHADLLTFFLLHSRASDQALSVIEV